MKRLVTLVTLLCFAGAVFGQVFKSRQEMVKLSGDDFKKALSAYDDPTGDVDRKLAKEMQIQNRCFMNTPLGTKVSFNHGNGTWVHPTGGICFDVDELGKILQGMEGVMFDRCLAAYVADYKGQAFLYEKSNYGLQDDDDFKTVTAQGVILGGYEIDRRLISLMLGMSLGGNGEPLHDEDNISYTKSVFMDQTALQTEYTKTFRLLDAFAQVADRFGAVHLGERVRSDLEGKGVGLDFMSTMSTLSQGKLTMDSVRKQLDMRDGEKIQEWSHRLAHDAAAKG